MSTPEKSTAKPPTFLYPRDVASYFGVTISTVRRWANQGILKAILTPGGHNRFPAAKFYRDIQAWEQTAVPAVAGEPALLTPLPATTTSLPQTADVPVPAITPLTDKPSALKVMIVEDNADMRSILVSLLENNNFQVTACVNGRMALDALTANPHASILSDIDMPVMNGQDFLCAAKKRFRESKIIMMSAGHCHRQAEFQGYGALGILSKSLGLIEIYRRIQALTEERRTSCRLPVRMPLAIDHRDQGALLDISADGALFETDHQYHRGLVEMSLLDNHGTAVLTAAGTVLRVVPREKKYLTAVRFDSTIGSQLGTLVRDGVVRPDLN